MKFSTFNSSLIGTVAACALLPTSVVAQQSTSDVAKSLSNPVADLISVPLEFDYDDRIGPADDGHRLMLNLQPVVPFSLNDNWNLISRTIVPVESQQNIFPGAGSQSGLGDTVQSFFFSPKAPTAGGWIWGAGPVLLLPTGTDKLLSGEKWGAGPTGVVLRLQGPWTYGVLVNHIWSFAGSSSRAKINATFVEPFLVYTTPTAWQYTLQTETSYDWTARKASVPINAEIAKIMKIGKQLVSIGGGVRYWVESPTGGPKDFGVRFKVTLLFPK